MAACPTCFTKVDITAAAVRAAKYASAARDRYERKYRQIKCDVAEVCVPVLQKSARPPALRRVPQLFPFPRSALVSTVSSGTRSGGRIATIGLMVNHDRWYLRVASGTSLATRSANSLTTNLTMGRIHSGIVIARNGTFRTICGAAGSPVGVSLTRLRLRMWRQTLTLGWLTPIRSRRQMIQTVASIRPASRFLS